jgi:hypothetical protein
MVPKNARNPSGYFVEAARRAPQAIVTLVSLNCEGVWSIAETSHTKESLAMQIEQHAVRI